MFFVAALLFSIDLRCWLTPLVCVGTQTKFFMRIKSNKTDSAELHRKSPGHVALILAGSKVSVEAEGGEALLANMIKVARHFGVGFLTFCCSGKDVREGAAKDGVGFQRLFSSDLEGFLDKNSSVRFLKEGEARHISGNGKLNISVISQIDGRAEIVDAVRRLAEKVEREEIVSNEINALMLGEQIAPIDLPDPDLLIFTGGLKRLKNVLLWQSAYAEFAFIDEDWDALAPEQFQAILENYMSRERRFGGLGKKRHSKAEAEAK